MARISGLCVAGVLVLCALLLTSEVKCQDDDATSAPDAPAASDDAVSSPTSAPETINPDSVQTGAPGDVPATGPQSGPEDSTDAPAPVPEEIPTVILPDVKCVGKDDITESTAVKAEVTTLDCDTTKSILESVPVSWCNKPGCQINIYQDDKTLLIDSGDASSSTLAQALQSEQMKEKLGVKDVKYTPSSSSSVFVGILVTGLLAAVALAVGYFKCQRRPSPKGERLAEEGTPVDQQNQANTLASDAPLNPPPETPEKPTENGESPEENKTEPPPTNGSTPANTADTEL